MIPTWGSAGPRPLFPDATFELNFARSAYFQGGGRRDGFLGITGASFTGSGTRFEANAAAFLEQFGNNVPRIGTDVGLYVRSAATNLFVRPREFENASWLKPQSDTVSANAVVGPDGNQLADTFVETSATSQHTLAQDVSGLVAGGTYGMFMDVKQRGRRFVHLRVTDAGDVNGFVAEFDLQTLATNSFINGTGTISSIGAIPLANGFVRCFGVGTLGAGITAARPRIRPIQGLGQTDVLTGLNGPAYDIAGAQLVAGSDLGAFVDGGASTGTYGADAPTITGLTPPAQGTLLVEAVHNSAASFPLALALNDNTLGNSLVLLASSTTGVRTALRSGGVVQAEIAGSNYTLGSTTRLAVTFAANDVRFYANGALIGSDSLATIPSMDRVQIGYQTGGFDMLNGAVRRAVLFPSPLSAAEAQALTA